MRLFNRLNATSLVSFLVLFLALAASTGCNIGFEGESGNMNFYYGTDSFSSKKPLAVNSDASIRVHLTQQFEDDHDIDDEDEAVELTSVESTNSSAISVEAFGESRDNEFLLSANSSGTTDIEVEGVAGDGTEVSDAFTLEARDIAEVELEPPCRHVEDGQSTEPVYLTEHNVKISKTLRGPQGEELTGRGYDPVQVSGPSDGAKLVDVPDDANHLVVAVGDEPGTVTVSSTVSDDETQLDVKTENEVDGISVDETPDTRVTPKITIDGRPLCQAKVELSDDNQTSSICSVNSYTTDDGEGLLGGYSTSGTRISVQPEKEGTCEFDVSVDASDSGASTSVAMETGPLLDEE